MTIYQRYKKKKIGAFKVNTPTNKSLESFYSKPRAYGIFNKLTLLGTQNAIINKICG